ncbi:MAG: hypothetical protein KAV82_06735 [Phycisphaerae bacterium]|nr:hypothetical protein [Phycisphaerae bacterium]
MPTAYKIDWGVVTAKHVQQALRRYEAGEHPDREPRNTFLIVDGNRYPAKFIRGLAYTIATGRKLNPSREFSGGQETVSFFKRLGMHVLPMPSPKRANAPKKTKVAKIAVVSHNYDVLDSKGRWDYSEDVSQINNICDQYGCDTIMYALYTWDTSSRIPRTHEAIFENLQNVKRILMEVGRLSAEDEDQYNLRLEFWTRDEEQPVTFGQVFGKATQVAKCGDTLVSSLEERRVADTMPIICGETNIVSISHKTKRASDPFHVRHHLAKLGVSVVLNPIHDRMSRWEMPMKRAFLSRPDRTVVSVWNAGEKKPKRSRLPWSVFDCGRNCTDAIEEVPEPISDRPDIRIGLLNLPRLRRTR